MNEEETKKNESSQETENIQAVEEETQPIIQIVEVKPQSIIQPIEEKNRPAKNEAEILKNKVEDIIQSTEPAEPVKSERNPVLDRYTKNGRTTMVVTDETYSAFKSLEMLDINVKSESEHNRERQWEAEAKRRRDEAHQEKMRDIQEQIAKLEKDKAEWEYIKSLTRRDDTVVRPIHYTVPESEETSWDKDDDENGDDEFNENEFEDLEDDE